MSNALSGRSLPLTSNGVANVMRATRLAGAVIREAFEWSEGYDPESKTDASPVTMVDLAAEAVLLRALEQAYPADRILSEESGWSAVKDSEFVWIIDPLDGTREFLKRNAGHFSISVARYRQEKDGWAGELGIIYDPIARTTIWAHEGSIFRQSERGDVEQVRSTASSAEYLSLMLDNGSTRNPVVERFAAELPDNVKILARGSALKIENLLLEPGVFYVRPTPQKEWDWAALCFIAEVAGLRVSDCAGQPIQFGHDPPVLAQGMAIAAPAIHDEILARLQRHLQGAALEDLCEIVRPRPGSGGHT